VPNPAYKIALLAALAAARPSLATERSCVVGTWEVVSYEMVSPATGTQEAVRGDKPPGYTIFTPDGRMMVLITNEGRKAPGTDQDRADLFQSMVSYTGTYRVEGDTWTTRVDVAANPAMVGTDQDRSFRCQDDSLQETTGLMPWALHPERGLMRFVITYRRVG